MRHRLRDGQDSELGEWGRVAEGPGPSFRKSHNLDIGLFIYAVCGYKEHLNVQHVTFCFPTTTVCLN